MNKKNILTKNIKRINILLLSAVFLTPLYSFAQNKTNESNTERVELKYNQRHSRHTPDSKLYADGIKIKRDLSILKEIQEERVLGENEIPAEELYGGIWNNRYVNPYRSLENIPDTFKVNLSNFTMPTMGYITSNFGMRRLRRRSSRMHYGIDLKLQTGDTVYAAFDGKVRVKQYEGRGYGYYLALRHPNGLETVYGHLSAFLVEEDQVVKSGDPIGLGGSTGRSTGSHLHFELRFLGNPINPIYIVDFDNKVCHRDTYIVTRDSYKTGSNGIDIRNIASSSVTRSNQNITNKYASGSVKYHRVQNGDTLGTIAKKHGTTVSKLCKLNNITTRSMLRVGKSLRVS
ncbi:MAG: peptidoglycan DD-metalloendopeptidase family protein [Prevotella sp.]|jgi:murein DD-endopeptidase MepM/ murein hydrolase activator NlpD|nr:peptidoglycan DD-metalloendopeptidase family protein [Prevotella sp.]